MSLLKTIQWLLGLVVTFYFYKALLGKLREGDGLKATIVAAIWLSTVVVTSGLVKIG
jgi:hypothetical protein